MHRHLKRRFTGLAGVLVAMTAGAPVATAAESTLSWGVLQRFEYDDNIVLSFENPVEVTGYTLRPLAGLEVRGERWDFAADAELAFARFSESSVDSDDQQLDVTAGWSTQLSRWQIDASLLRDSTRTAELEETGVGLGRTRAPEATRRELVRVRPSWRRTFGPRDQLSVSASIQDVRYDSPRFSNYEYLAFDTAWSHTLRPRTSLQVTAFANRFDSDVATRFVPGPAGVIFLDSRTFGSFGVDQRATDSIGVEGGIVHVFSERWSGQALLGVRNVTAEMYERVCLESIGLGSDELCISEQDSLSEQSARNTGGVGTLELTYAGERLKATGLLKRSLSPSGLGLLLERDELRVGISYPFSERLEGALEARVYLNESTESDEVFQRNIYRIQPELRWRLNEAWSLEGGLRYRTRIVDDLFALNDAGEPEQLRQQESANSLSVFVFLRYRPSPRRVFD